MLKVEKLQNQIIWPCPLSDELKQTLISGAKVIKARKDDFLDDRVNQGILYIVSGILTPCMLTKGVKAVTGIVLSKGCWLGDTGLDNTPHPHMQIEVIESATIIIFSKAVCKKAAEQFEQTYKWLWHVNIDISGRWLQAQVIKGENLMVRLIYLLIDIAAHQGSSQQCSFPINVSQFQISSMTGISRSRVNEALKELVCDQQVEVNRAHIKIIDFKALGDRLDLIDLTFRDPRKLLK